MQQITEIFWETQNVQLVLVETGRNVRLQLLLTMTPCDQPHSTKGKQ